MRRVLQVAAFLHDWRNAMGYVSKHVDQEMLAVMMLLYYPVHLIAWRYFLTRFTFLNKARHRILKTYLGDKPEDLFTLLN